MRIRPLLGSWTLVGLGVLALGLFVAPASGQRGGFRVVVNTANPVESMTGEQVARAFLKRTSTWAHGEPLEPVDQGSGAEVRARFSEDVFEKEVPWIKSFWQKQIFSGRAAPPPELASDAAVLAFVRSKAGAIGYVGTSTPLGPGVKAIELVP